MEAHKLHLELEGSFKTFFEDFNYIKQNGKSIYVQKSAEGHKYIYFNITDYDDGIMAEFMLGISHPKVEYQLSELIGSALHGQHHLTFHIYPDSLDQSVPKREFIQLQDSIETHRTMMESFFVNKAFYWLDDYSASKKLSDLLALTLIKGGLADLNFKLSALRSLLLKRLLGEQITEDLFYTYLELMQEKGLPEKEIEEYAHLRKHFIVRS